YHRHQHRRRYRHARFVHAARGPGDAVQSARRLYLARRRRRRSLWGPGLRGHARFVAGLMVGRTPEYIGKKIETREMKLAMLAVLIYPLVVLGFAGVAVMLQT